MTDSLLALKNEIKGCNELTEDGKKNVEREAELMVGKSSLAYLKSLKCSNYIFEDFDMPSSDEILESGCDDEKRFIIFGTFLFIAKAIVDTELSLDSHGDVVSHFIRAANINRGELSKIYSEVSHSEREIAGAYAALGAMGDDIINGILQHKNNIDGFKTELSQRLSSPNEFGYDSVINCVIDHIVQVINHMGAICSVFIVQGEIFNHHQKNDILKNALFQFDKWMLDDTKNYARTVLYKSLEENKKTV